MQNIKNAFLFRNAGSDCSPFLRPNETDAGKIYAPCGAIANSLFSDDIYLGNYK